MKHIKILSVGVDNGERWLVCLLCDIVGYTMNVVYFGWVDSAVQFQDDLYIPQFTLLGTKQNDCSQNYTAGQTIRCTIPVYTGRIT